MNPNGQSHPSQPLINASNKQHEKDLQSMAQDSYYDKKTQVGNIVTGKA